MPLALWTEEYEMGVESLDADHIIIFSLINHVDKAIQLENNEKAIRKIFKVLIRHAIAHFQSEEASMIKHAFPHTEGHVEEHHQIVEKLQTLFIAYEENPDTDISSKIVKILANWANIHVLQTDLLYRDFLQKRLKGV